MPLLFNDDRTHCAARFGTQNIENLYMMKSHKPKNKYSNHKKTSIAKDTVVNSTDELKHEVQGTHQPRDIKKTGEGANTAQRSNSFVQSTNRSFSKKSFDFSAWSLKLAVVAVGIAALSIIGYRLSLFDYQIALLGLAVTAFSSILAIVIGSIGTWRAKKANEPDITATLAGSTLGLLVVVPIFVHVVTGIGKPMIHDISTDLVNPPEFVAVKTLRDETHNSLDRSEPTNLAALQQESYPDLGPLIIEDSVDRVFKQAVEWVKKRGWEVIAISAANGRIEATDTTPIMGFKDDVVIRIQAEDDFTRVDMRSASRVGKGDLGTNAARIHNFLETLGQQW